MQCPHRQRGVCDDLVNLEICGLSPSEVLIGIGFVYIHRGECACMLWASTLYCVISKKKLVWLEFSSFTNELSLWIYACFGYVGGRM